MHNFQQFYKVYYEDTDAGGVVYHANYLKFMERCRSDWLASIGFDVQYIEKHYGLMFVLRRADIQFHLPARLSDDLRITCEILQLGKVKLMLRQAVYNKQQLLCEADIKLATLDSKSFTVQRMPQEILAGLEADSK